MYHRPYRPTRHVPSAIARRDIDMVSHSAPFMLWCRAPPICCCPAHWLLLPRPLAVAPPSGCCPAQWLLPRPVAVAPPTAHWLLECALNLPYSPVLQCCCWTIMALQPFVGTHARTCAAAAAGSSVYRRGCAIAVSSCPDKCACVCVDYVCPIPLHLGVRVFFFLGGGGG